MNKKPSFIVRSIVFSLCLFFISSPVVEAQKANPEFYSRNDILFYNPEDGTCSVQTGSFGTLVGNSNAERIWNFLIGKGLNDNQAAGLMGNLKQESNYDPGIEERIPNRYGTRGFGIAQWTGARRTALENAARAANKPVNDLGLQLQFMYDESNSRTAKPSYGGGNEWNGLKRQQTIDDALVYWHDNFERSADSREAVIRVRGGYAREAFNSFATGTEVPRPTEDTDPTETPAPNCPNGTTPGGSSISSGDFSAAVLAYAHPEFHKPNYTQMMPAYGQAVTKAQREGRFVGGGHNPGIDCGGFVTTLLVDSGFEPEYNSGQGNTVIQKQWLDSNWTSLGKGNVINVADLQPGDVAMRPGHTFVYVGNIPGFDSDIASASYGGTSSSPAWRAPMAGLESKIDSRVTWYRKA